MKHFRIYWLDKTTELVSGTDIADAFRRAGLGGGSINAVDYFEEVNEDGTPKNERRTGHGKN